MDKILILEQAIAKKYRKIQLEKVATEYSEFKTKIKIIKPNGETKWLDIENAEFDAIKNILVGGHLSETDLKLFG